MKTFAFIFARGGSKGLPNKNLLKINNKSLVNHSVDCAKESNACEKIFVSSDSDEILDLAGDDVVKIKRPDELSGDKDPEWLAWQHAINFAEKNYGKFEIFISLPPTSPFKKSLDINNAIKTLNDSSSDICISITPSSRNPFFNMVKKDGPYLEIFNKTKNKIYNRQDAQQCFDITTNVYAAKKSFIKNKTYMFDGKVSFIEIPKIRSIDIDDEVDFLIAKTVMENKNV